MKLINRTYILTAKWILPLIVAGTVFCFYMIEYISYEETDEFLTYEMKRLVNYHQEYDDLPEFHQVAAILPDVRYEKPFFKDTLLLEPEDNEMVPYRELYFTINHKGSPQTIVLRHLLLGHDDMAEGALLISAGLMLLIAVFLYAVVNRMTGKIWAPFYQTLDKLVKFKISGPLPRFEPVAIDEFRSLNQTLEILLKKIADDYRHNKEFGENASHELQTHLAIIRTNTEKLLNNPGSTGNITELQKIYSAVTTLSQVQRSLLLLSKINNQEYDNPVRLDLRQAIEQSLETFAETILLRNIHLDTSLDRYELTMDAGLAKILADNLIKNAVKYNIEQGMIRIALSPSTLVIENSGLPFYGDAETMLNRFAKGDNGNIGIGLAIVKQICERYRFTVSYQVIDHTLHRIIILFHEK